MFKKRGTNALNECRCVGCSQTLKSRAPRNLNKYRRKPEERLAKPVCRTKVLPENDGKIVAFKLWELNHKQNDQVNAQGEDDLSDSGDRLSPEILDNGEQEFMELGDLIHKVLRKDSSVLQTDKTRPPLPVIFPILKPPITDICDSRYQSSIEIVYLATKADSEAKTDDCVGNLTTYPQNAEDAVTFTNDNLQPLEFGASYFSSQSEQDSRLCADSCCSSKEINVSPLSYNGCLNNGQLRYSYLSEPSVVNMPVKLEPQPCDEPQSDIKISAVFSLTSSEKTDQFKIEGDIIEAGLTSEINEEPITEACAAIKNEPHDSVLSRDIPNYQFFNGSSVVADDAMDVKESNKQNTTFIEKAYGLQKCFVKLENIDIYLDGKNNIKVGVLKRLLLKRLHSNTRKKRYCITDPGKTRYYLLHLGTKRLIVPTSQFGARPMGFLVKFGVPLKIPSSLITVLPFDMTISAIYSQSKNVSELRKVAQYPQSEYISQPNDYAIVDDPKIQSDVDESFDQLPSENEELLHATSESPTAHEAASLTCLKHFKRRKEKGECKKCQKVVIMPNEIYSTGSLKVKFKLMKSNKPRKIRKRKTKAKPAILPQSENKEAIICGGNSEELHNKDNFLTDDMVCETPPASTSDKYMPSSYFQAPASLLQIKIEPDDQHFEGLDSSSIRNSDKMANTVEDIGCSFKPIDTMNSVDLHVNGQKTEFTFFTEKANRIQMLKEALREKANALDIIRKTMNIKKELSEDYS